MKNKPGFQLVSKIITRFAETRLIPKPPAIVEIKNNDYDFFQHH